MTKISNAVVDANLRSYIFNDLFGPAGWRNDDYHKINDRQYGIILIDDNDVERYCRIEVIVAEEQEEITARELMKMEIDAYKAKQAEKVEKDNATREEKKDE